MKKIILIAATFALISCKKEAQETHMSTNPEFQIELLFEKDGCKMYRFYDGHYIYWSDCSGNVSYQYKSGKNNVVKSDCQTTR